jgi:hypothetical protein
VDRTDTKGKRIGVTRSDTIALGSLPSHWPWIGFQLSMFLAVSTEGSTVIRPRNSPFRPFNARPFNAPIAAHPAKPPLQLRDVDHYNVVPFQMTVR